MPGAALWRGGEGFEVKGAAWGRFEREPAKGKPQIVGPPKYYIYIYISVY